MGQNLHANMEGFCRASRISYCAIIWWGKILMNLGHLPMLYLPIFSLPVIYSIGSYFGNLMLELLLYFVLNTDVDT